MKKLEEKQSIILSTALEVVELTEQDLAEIVGAAPETSPGWDPNPK